MNGKTLERNKTLEADLKFVAHRKKELPRPVRENADEIREVSRFIHSNPELGSEEFKASALLSSKLLSHGIQVTKNYLNMKTSFLGKVGTGGPKIAIFAEYDALPIGHACGHNLIAAWAYGVAIAFASSPPKRGTLYVVGSPAEESRGDYASSKVIIAPKLKDLGIEAAIGVHPAGTWGVGGGTLARTRLSFIFTGKDAHDAGSPEQGINALDAAVNFYIQLKMMRTQVERDKDVIIGAVIVRGGTAPNVIPGNAEIWIDLRSNDSTYINKLEDRVKAIADGAAMMTGCKVESIALAPRTASAKRAPQLEKLIYRHASEYLARLEKPDELWRVLPTGSSDISNVSQEVPLGQLMIKIGREGLPGHSEEWRDRAGTLEAEEALLTSVAIGYDSILEYISSAQKY
jgi:amidohydrolase